MTARPSRHLIFLGALLAAAFGPTAPTSASATKTIGFRLTNTTSAPVSEMYFDLIPSGSVVPPILGTDEDGQPLEGSPMTALPSSTGIDVSTSYVLLTEDPNDSEMERMFLLFGYEPDPEAAPGEVPFRPLVDDQGHRIGQLGAGGTFDFELSVAQDTIAYLLKPGVDGLTLDLLDLESPDPDSPPAPQNPSPDPGPTTPIPEPSALLLWTALGGAALAVARRRRRCSPTPSLS